LLLSVLCGVVTCVHPILLESQSLVSTSVEASADASVGYSIKLQHLYDTVKRNVKGGKSGEAGAKAGKMINENRYLQIAKAIGGNPGTPQKPAKPAKTQTYEQRATGKKALGAQPEEPAVKPNAKWTANGDKEIDLNGLLQELHDHHKRDLPGIVQVGSFIRLVWPTLKQAEIDTAAQSLNLAWAANPFPPNNPRLQKALNDHNAKKAAAPPPPPTPAVTPPKTPGHTLGGTHRLGKGPVAGGNGGSSSG